MSQYLKDLATYPSLATGATAGDPVNITGAHNHALQICLGADFAGPVTLTVEVTGLAMPTGEEDFDPCAPDDTGWTDLGEIQKCGERSEFEPFTVILDLEDEECPATPGSCCFVALPVCAAAFVRVNADVADAVTVNILQTRLKRNA